MNTTIRIRVRKDIDTATEKKIMKLKGSLISESYTDVIHFDDDGEDFYINHFVLTEGKHQDARNFIRNFSEENSLTTIINIL